VARVLGIATFASKRYEADDLIGSLAARHATRSRPAVIVSRDKDLAQLITDGDTFWDYAADERHDVASITRKLGVPPSCIPDLLGLAGDAVDNIPGVAGIGSKTAIALLDAFGSLDAVYANLDRVATLKLRGAKAIAARLHEGREQAMLSRELATIHCDIPLKTTLADLRWTGVNTRAANRFFNELGFGATLRRQVERL